MIKYVIGEPTGSVDTVIRLWLEYDDETQTVDLKASLASGEGGPYYLLMLQPNGTIARAECISEDLGLQLDSVGRVIINDVDEENDCDD